MVRNLLKGSVSVSDQEGMQSKVANKCLSHIRSVRSVSVTARTKDRRTP